MESTTPAKSPNGVEAAEGKFSKYIGISSTERLSLIELLKKTSSHHYSFQ
jgi:hypothetical protein